MLFDNVFFFELVIVLLFVIFCIIVSLIDRDIRRYIFAFLIGLIFIMFSRMIIAYFGKLYVSLTLLFVGFSILFYVFFRLSKMFISIKRLEKIAIYDSLTGVYNRLFMEELLKDRIDKANRLDQVFSIILVDLNDFKLVNDKYGHVTGDAALAWIAKQMKENIRYHDIIARWGGDEFLILIPDDPCVNVLNIVYRLQNNVTFEKGDVKITLSTGYACFPKDGRDMETLLKKADERMYKIKRIIKEAKRYGMDDKGKEEV